nr:bacteriophage tail fiber protein [uncultured Mediterranean phage uvMED]
MATHDYSLANQSGAAFRGDLNNALSAIASNNSSSTDPATTFAHQFYYDTGDTTFKIRNAANSAYINISAVGGAETANFGLALAASPTFTGTATFAGNILMSGTGTLDLPVGTTAQRPGTPNNGMVRYNSTLSRYEGYSGSAWGALGGGATGGGSDQIFHTNGQSVSTDFTLVGTLNAMSAGPISIASGVTVTVSSGATWTVV